MMGWQWHQLDHANHVYLAPDRYHANTSTLRFLQAGCPSCRGTISIKALKANYVPNTLIDILFIIIIIIIIIIIQYLYSALKSCKGYRGTEPSYLFFAG